MIGTAIGKDNFTYHMEKWLEVEQEMSVYQSEAILEAKRGELVARSTAVPPGIERGGSSR